jgi:hypothetical protein
MCGARRDVRFVPIADMLEIAEPGNSFGSMFRGPKIPVTIETTSEDRGLLAATRRRFL